MIKIDGNHLEGGGQIVRTALALSAITGKPFEVNDIRKGRKDGGLKSQHLFGVKALKEMCDASVDGDFLGSEKLLFVPRKLKGKTLPVDIGTAGSVTLLLQSILLPAMVAPPITRIKLTGGTDVSWSPSIDYFQFVLLPFLRNLVDIDFSLERRGYHPAGAGKIELKVKPRYLLQDSFDELLADIRAKTKPINIVEQGTVVMIKGISHASNDLRQQEVAERQEKAARLSLAHLNVPVKIESRYSETLSTGSGITLWAVLLKGNESHAVLGADSLASRSKRAEVVGEECAQKLIEEIKSKAPIDSHMADQILPFLALSGGSIKVAKLTNHARTNIYTIEQFLGKVFEVEEGERIIEVKQ